MAEKLCYGCMKPKSQIPVCEHCGYDERSQNSSAHLPVGTIVGGQYILGRVLGQGGFGITYIGWDQIMNTPVAVKEYFPGGFAGRDTANPMWVTSYDSQNKHVFESNKKRFLREAESLAKLWNIPQIVRILRYFEENGTAYIVMEYVGGVDLRKQLKQQKKTMNAQEVLSLMKPVLEALEQVHDKNLVHRDISPDNIMLQPDGCAKLLDFGAARYVESPDAEGSLNTSTQAILKHGFAPPEQYQSKGALGPWTDIYALCATYYYCLTGKVPPEAMNRMMGTDQIDWNQIPGLTERQKKAFEKGMALQPKDRYQSVKQLREMLYVEPEQQAAEEKIDVKKKRSGKGLWAGLLVAIAGVSCMLLLGGNGQKVKNKPESPASNPAITVPTVQKSNSEAEYKIAVITGQESMAWEEFFVAQNLKAKYGNKVITATYPDDISAMTEQIITMVADPDVKAIVFAQPVSGTADVINKVRQTREDILFISSAAMDDAAAISTASDICMTVDEINMGTTIIEQAVAMGAKTFVHISFDRHLNVDVIAERQALFKENCASLGLEYVEATAPDPIGAAGITGAQAWITENIRAFVNRYSKDTAFFCTACPMQVPLIQQCAELGAIYPQQCCPSVFHGYLSAFNISIQGHEGDIPYILAQIEEKVAEYGNTNRMSTWEVPVNMVMLEAGFNYAQKWIEGEIKSRCDDDALLKEIKNIAGEKNVISKYKGMENYFAIMCPYYTF